MEGVCCGVFVRPLASGENRIVLSKYANFLILVCFASLEMCVPRCAFSSLHDCASRFVLDLLLGGHPSTKSARCSGIVAERREKDAATRYVLCVVRAFTRTRFLKKATMFGSFFCGFKLCFLKYNCALSWHTRRSVIFWQKLFLSHDKSNTQNMDTHSYTSNVHTHWIKCSHSLGLLFQLFHLHELR